MTLISQLSDAAARDSGPLADFRSAKEQLIAGWALPNRKTESWKYSANRLKTLQGLNSLTASSHAPPAASCALEAYEITLNNGELASLPDKLPAGLSLTSFADLSPEQGALIRSGIAASSDDLPFAAFNDARHQQGLFIDIADKTCLEKPIRILLAHQGDGISLPRIFLKLGKFAEATLIQEFHIRGQHAFVNALEDYRIDEGAKLSIIRMNEASDDARFIGATGVSVQQHAYFESHNFAAGCALGRHDLRVSLQGRGGHCKLNGVSVTQGKQHFDHHTSIDHVAPHCSSDENYRCIADDQSHIVFDGRIHILPGAQKTSGAMSNRNLLLSSGAEIDSKPELEIYADDVKCAHGCTIGQLDPNEVYYLKTRGMSDQQARQMLTLGFVLEIVQDNPVPAIAQHWEDKLSLQLSLNDA